jgi:hypothetical protein
MRPGVPALVAICVVFSTPRTSHAEDQARVQVAVIDLSVDSTGAALVDIIYTALNKSELLRNPDKHTFDALLKGPLFDEDKPHFDTAKDKRDAAKSDLLTQYDSKQALRDTDLGLKELQLVTPTDDVRALYAELTLYRGLALLDQHDVAGAARAFALTHRLDPTTQLDPTQYSPDITEAFARAIDAKAVPAKLAVKGEGHIWVDGRERGDAPADVDVEAGDHVVVLTGPERLTRGDEARVQAPTGELAIADKAASDEVKVQRLRLALSRAQARGDDAGRGGAMRQIAALIGVGDAVLISKHGNNIQLETWVDRAPGFSAPKIWKGQKAEILLEGITPARADDETPKGPVGPFVRTQPEGEKSWYERRWVQASAATGLAAVIVGAILWARRDVNTTFNPDVKGM